MKNLLLIVLFLFNSLVFSANVYFDTPNPGDVSSGRTYSSSCTFGNAPFSYHIQTVSFYFVVNYYGARIQYPDGSWSGWQSGQSGGWAVTKAGTYKIQGKVHVVYDLGGSSNYDMYSNILTFYVVDTCAPAIPENLSVTESVNDHPLLAWDTNTEYDLEEYRIFRKRGSPFIDWTLIATDTSSPYEDTGVNTSHHYGDDIFYKITAKDINSNESDYSNTVEIEARIEKKMIDENNEAAPKEYALNANYPNPFNPTTIISYEIPENCNVNLVVYNPIGQIVVKLVNEHQSSGKYSIQFNAANLPNGVYYYKLQTNSFTSVKKMLLLK